MVRGRQRDQWWHTADLKAALFEPNRDSKKRSTPFTAAEFHPFEKQNPRMRAKSREEVKSDIRAMASMFGAEKK